MTTSVELTNEYRLFRRWNEDTVSYDPPVLQRLSIKTTTYTGSQRGEIDEREIWEDVPTILQRH